MINVEQARQCINHIIKSSFDTHDFIEQFKIDFERDYVEILYAYIIVPNGIFRAAHAQIGRFLSEHQAELNIHSVDKGVSLNTKGYLSENQKWERRNNIYVNE